MNTIKTLILFAAILCLGAWTVMADHVRFALGGKDPDDDDITPAPWTGTASWYGEGYRGKRMANGHPFNPDAMTCAAWEWPIGTVLLVTHRHHTVRVVVTDRGPALKFKDRIIDLSRGAFSRIAHHKLGVVAVTVTVEATPKQN